MAVAGATAHGLEIVITQGWDSPTRIAVVPFGGPPLRDRPGPVATIELADVVAFDLQRSGQFDALPSGDMLSLPTMPEEVLFRDWRILDMDYVVIGRAWEPSAGVREGPAPRMEEPSAGVREGPAPRMEEPSAGAARERAVREGPARERAERGEVSILYYLYDVAAEREIRRGQWTVPPTLIRDVAHRISDDVYEAVTGIRGAFGTKILYVLVEDAGTPQATYSLIVADADGERERTLYRSSEPILSPSWAPDLDRVAYVSFETGRSTIVVQNVESGERRRVAEYRGINGAPVFSPTGDALAMSLSRDGNPEIYIKDLVSGDLRRITRSPAAIDTEPIWAPDGASLIFTSDRGGRPQIYRKDLRTALEERLTFEGSYNARARLLPDGRHLVYVHRGEGASIYHIAWQDLERGTVKVLTETALDESPSLAPNGTMMMYATRERGRGILAVVSIDGRVKYILPSARGDVREPAWSPYVDALGPRG